MATLISPELSDFFSGFAGRGHSEVWRHPGDVVPKCRVAPGSMKNEHPSPPQVFIFGSALFILDSM
jgi:hypothetical protein